MCVGGDVRRVHVAGGGGHLAGGGGRRWWRSGGHNHWAVRGGAEVTHGGPVLAVLGAQC